MTKIKEPNKINEKLIRINQQYFSGSQVSVFIGDIWIDDITSIDFNLSDSKKPKYGYGSEYFDFVSYGRKLVTGSFTINFREPNYIWLALQREKELRGNGLVQQKQQNIEDSIEDAIDYNTSIGDKRRNYDLFFNTTNAKAVRDKMIELNRVSSVQNSRSNSAYKTNHLGFDIIIAYGNEINQNTIGQKIIDTHIIGNGKTVMIDGRPIQEQYNFFARDLK